MYYIIGPRHSAEALARKTGLRGDEWHQIGSVSDIPAKRLDSDVVLETHDAHRYLTTDVWTALLNCGVKRAGVTA